MNTWKGNKEVTPPHTPALSKKKVVVQKRVKKRKKKERKKT